MNPIDATVHRVRAEYLEMPGLCLTLNQAQRFWNLHPEQCEEVLKTLVGQHFLHRNDHGIYRQRTTR